MALQADLHLSNTCSRYYVLVGSVTVDFHEVDLKRSLSSEH